MLLEIRFRSVPDVSNSVLECAAVRRRRQVLTPLTVHVGNADVELGIDLCKSIPEDTLNRRRLLIHIRMGCDRLNRCTRWDLIP